MNKGFYMLFLSAAVLLTVAPETGRARIGVDCINHNSRSYAGTLPETSAPFPLTKLTPALETELTRECNAKFKACKNNYGVSSFPEFRFYIIILKKFFH